MKVGNFTITLKDPCHAKDGNKFELEQVNVLSNSLLFAVKHVMDNNRIECGVITVEADPEKTRSELRELFITERLSKLLSQLAEDMTQYRTLIALSNKIIEDNTHLLDTEEFESGARILADCVDMIASSRGKVLLADRIGSEIYSILNASKEI